MNFKTIFEMENLTHAAMALNTGQSTLSKSLKRIEDYYSVVLFERTRHGLISSDKAKDLYKIVCDLEDKLINFQYSEASHSGRKIHIGMTMVWESILKDIISLQQDYSITIDTSENYLLYEKVISRECDFALCRFLMEELPDSKMIFYPLFKMRQALFISKGVEDWKTASFVKLHNLQDKDLSEKGEREVFSLYTKPIMTVHHYTTLLKIMNTDLYWTILPDMYEKLPEETSLKKVEGSEDFFSEYWCGIAYLKDSENIDIINKIIMDIRNNNKKYLSNINKE